MLQTSPSKRTNIFSRADLSFLCLLTAVGLFVGVRGILNFGYVGQDFPSNRSLVLQFGHVPLSYYYGWTNPPGFFWVCGLVWSLVGPARDLKVDASALLVLNSAALWVVYGFLWRSIGSRELRYCAAALVTLVPFRVIHAIVLPWILPRFRCSPWSPSSWPGSSGTPGASWRGWASRRPS
jgi:hypothetical protein